MTINRRTFLGTTLAASAGMLVADRGFAQTKPFTDLYEAAKKEGELTWYIAHWRTETAERVGKAFMEAYPGVKVNVVRATGQVIYQRLTQDMKAKVAACDVFSSSDLGQYVTLREMKALMPYEPKNLVDCEPLVRDFDPTHQITITDSNTTVLAYNTNLVQAADAPKKWTDLLDPKWSGQVAVAHPGFSGAMGGWVVTMTKMYGWDYFEKLKANKPLVGRSLVDPPTAMSSGERKVGLGPGSLVVNLASKGSPLKSVYPEDGTILGFGPTSIVATSVRPNAARLFVEFLLGKETGAIVTGEFTVPVRSDIEPRPGIAKMGSMKGIIKKPEELAAALPELIEKWRDTFGV
jgi:iron(III) transport system substrate-binding protein